MTKRENTPATAQKDPQPPARGKWLDSTGEFINHLLVYFGALATVLSCAIAFITLVAPKTVYDVVVRVYSEDTPTPQIVLVTVPPEPTLPQPSLTPAAPQVVEVTRIVIITNTPEPLPSATSTLAVSVLFQDSFAGRWGDRWTILSGEPFITNDRLTTADTVWMVIGDESWKNYRVEFTVYNTYRIVSNLQNLDNYVGVRFQDTRNMVAYRWAANLADWAVVENGNLTRVPDTGYEPGHQGFPFKITIIVKENEFEVANGPKFSTGKFQNGGIALRLTGGTTIDDFSVEELP